MKFTDFDPSATTFPAILEKQTYIDKSSFIKYVLEDSPCVLITGPRHSCKSTNLNMLRHFVEIEVDTEGTPLEIGTNQGLFNKILYNGTRLKILDEIDFYQEHFGKYPIMTVDFKCDCIIDSFDAGVNCCGHAIRNAYKQCDYLSRSVKLDDYHRNKCEYWCSDCDIDKDNVTIGLQDLCECLYVHFGNKQIIILIDEYDSIIRKAFFTLENDIFLKLIEFCICAISNGIRQNLLIANVVITGILDINQLYGLDFATHRSFLAYDNYIGYYGLGNDQLDELLRVVQGENEISKETLKLRYGGYINKNLISTNSLWSILNSLDEQKRGNYIEESDTIKTLTNAFRLDPIRKYIQQMVQGSHVNIPFDRIEFTNITLLQNVFVNPHRLRGNREFSGIFFLFLLNQGYLTYTKEQYFTELLPYPTVNFNIANEEAREMFVGKLDEYYKKMCKFNPSLRDICKMTFDEIIDGNCRINPESTPLQSIIERLGENLRNLVKEGSCLRLNTNAIYTSVCYIFFQSEYRCYTQYPAGEKLSEDGLALAKGDCGLVVISLKSLKDTSTELIDYTKQKHGKVFEDKRLFPDDINRIFLMYVLIDDYGELPILIK